METTTTAPCKMRKLEYKYTIFCQILSALAMIEELSRTIASSDIQHSMTTIKVFAYLMLK